MGQIDFSVSPCALLTGAGFTHNFGGFLAKNMWAEIYNRYRRYTVDLTTNNLLHDLKLNFNYEELYESVVYGGQYSPSERKAFIAAVGAAYETLDDIIRDHKNQTRFVFHRPVNINHVDEFLSRFSETSVGSGFFFTLNQDIFVERYLSPRIVLPGIRLNYARFNVGADKNLEHDDYAKVPDENELNGHQQTLKSLAGPKRLYYIKLHGSHDWRDKKDDNVLVIGTSKSTHINREPVLAWYWQLFKEVLSLPNRRLLIVGYGFQDNHINELICRSIQECNLKIFIISPEDPENFSKYTLPIHDPLKNIMWNAIAGYYPYTLSDLFPHGDTTVLYKNLAKDFFGS